MAATKTSKPIVIGHGIFTWDARERRTNRYGSFSLTDETFDSQVKDHEFQYNLKALKKYAGKRVSISVTVNQTRKSAHYGDAFLGIYPSTPNIDQTFILGTGTLFHEIASWSHDQFNIGIQPTDHPRTEFWLDPRILYQLHEQTVTVSIIPTNDPDHPEPNLDINADEGAIQLEDGDLKNVSHGKPWHFRSRCTESAKQPMQSVCISSETTCGPRRMYG